MTSIPIADHALLSDCHTAALVTRGGSVDWWCARRFDGPAVFARILDDEAGHFSISPVHTVQPPTRVYLPDTLVLETTFRTASGTATLTEAMALGPAGDVHGLGERAPGVLLRRIAVTEGTVTFRLSFAPRPEYGLITPLLAAVEGGVRARGGADVLLLSAPDLPTDLAIDDGVAGATFVLEAGGHAITGLQHRLAEGEAPRVFAADELEEMLDQTVLQWQEWTREHATYDGPYADLVHHSGLVLHALTYRPTGAIVAAPTTSLPESVGGARNWDYRYTWVRDASLTLDALYTAACPDEAHHFFEFMAGASATALGGGGELQIMFGIGGEHDLSERELGHLAGYADSSPVRVGNGAWDQRQLDVYGELLGAARRLHHYLGDIDDATKRFLIDAAETAALRWEESDEGIWEVRGGRREFTYSKLMCWAAMDHAIALAELLGAQDRVRDWTATREEIRAAIESRGWSERANSYAQSFDADELDASVLMMPIVGFVSADEPRMLATIDAIARDLTDEAGLVYRYRSEDGLAGDEGTFLLCTFWLAQAQALAGRVEDAKATFERAISFANDVGLLAEEVDAAGEALLGNFPQAFSHIGLVNAAAAIAAASGA